MARCTVFSCCSVPENNKRLLKWTSTLAPWVNISLSSRMPSEVCLRPPKRLIAKVALVVKNLPAIAGAVREAGSTPGSGRHPGGGRGNPVQYCCLENPTDREAWCVTVRRVAESQTRLKQLSRAWHMLHLNWEY